MADEGVVVALEGDFIRKLEEADEALDKMVRSVDNLSNSLNKLASGGLSRFASIIDGITGSVANLSEAKIGDIGLSEVSNSAADAVDDINDIINAVQQVKEAGAKTSLSFNIGDYIKPSEVKAKIEKTEKAIENATDKLEYWQNKLSANQEFDPTMQKADTKKAVKKIAEWEAQIKSLNETYKRLNDDLEVARARAQELANAANSTEFKDIATWKAIKEAQKELLDTGGYASRVEQQPVVDKFAQAQEQIKEQMVSTKEFAEANDDERYQMALRNLARRQKAQDDAAKAQRERLEEDARVQNEIEESRYRQSLKHLDDESKAIEKGQKAKEDSRKDYAKADTAAILKAREEREKALEAEKKAQEEAIKNAQKAYTEIVNEIQADYKKVVDELNKVADQKYKLDLFKAKHGENAETKKADEEILRRQTELNAKRESLEANYQKHITGIVKANEKNRGKEIIDNIERQTRIAMENQRRIDNEKKKSDEADKKRIHEERTTFSGAMGYSNTTKSINEQIQAIKYLEEARNKLDKTTLGAEEYKRQVKEINNEIKRQKKEIDGLVGKQRDLHDTSGKLRSMLGTMFSIHAIRGYVNQIARVRGEFELQQRSLQALLQSKGEANKLWSQTVQLAVKSPFQVKELITYTKQLAAYRVETEKLHDTTKMLADISAGLGVDMGRLILAFGQVKAANYLRGTELRQFSEAGINILDELARYYTALEGKAVSVGQVFERVSKRMVSFADVEKVLQNVTSAGGMFYRMQEEQADTLKGQISNLKDQLDIMLNDIGVQNEAIMKGGVKIANWLIRNYKLLLPVLSTVSVGFVAMQMSMLKAKLGTEALAAGVKSLKAVMLSPWTILLAGVAALVSGIIRYNHKLNQIERAHERFNDSLIDIQAEMNDAMNADKIDDARVALNKLLSTAKKDFKIDLGLSQEDIAKLDADAIAKKFAEIRQKVFDAEIISKQLAEGFAKAESWDTGFLRGLQFAFTEGQYGKAFDEGLKRDADQYQESASKLLSILQRLGLELAANADIKLPPEHPFRALQNADEGDLEYLERLINEFKKLKTDNDIVRAEIDFTAIDKAIDEYNSRMNEASKEARLFLDRTLGDTATLAPEIIEAALNNFINNTPFWTGYKDDLIRKLMGFESDSEKPTVQPTVVDQEEQNQDTRNYWDELTNTVKEVNSAYKELNETFDDTVAKQGAIEKYTEALDEILSKITADGKKLSASSFMDMFDLTTEEGMLNALDMIASKAPEAADKLKAKLEKGEIIWDAKVALQKDSDKALSEHIEDLFSGYQLSLELGKMNIPTDFAEDFFDIAVTSLDKLRPAILEAFDMSDLANKPNEDIFESERFHKLSNKRQDELRDALNKEAEMERKANEDRLKSYTKYLIKGQGERVKIKLDELRQLQDIESLPFDKGQKELARQGVRAEAKKRLEKLEWEEFKDSGMYVRLFEDLEFASTKTIQSMRAKLNELKVQLADLDADDLKHLYDQLEKLDEELMERNPYKVMAQNATSYMESLGRLKSAEKELAQLRESESFNKKRLSDISVRLAKEESIYEQMSDSNDASKEDLDTQRQKVSELNLQLAVLKAQLLAQGKLTKELEDEIDAIARTRKMFTGSAEEIGRDISDVANALPQVAGHLENVFGVMSDGARDAIDSIATIGSGIGDAISGFASDNPVQAVMGIVQAIGAIFSIGDKAKERKIQRELKHVEELDKRYKEISDVLDTMYSSLQMESYTKELNANIDSQIASYERMRALEEDKKKSDQDKIDEYNQAILDLNKQRDEMFAEQQSKATGGILDDALNAAEGFVDAWLEAFRETGDGLSGLEGEFEDMMTSLLKRQAAMQIVGAYTKMYSEWLKAYINPEGGDVNLSAEEAREWAEKVKSTFPELSAALEAFFSGTQDLMQEQGELSELSKGIQGVTESTAQVLEALLNSMRFYVADSNVQLKNIAAAFASNDVGQNPLLNELRQQTALVRSIESMFDSVIGRGGSSHSGAFLKVAM